MTRALPFVLLAAFALPSAAQSDDPVLAPTAAAFRSDLATITHVAATAALAHNQTGAFPDTPFDLLGRSWATATELRTVPFSAMLVERTDESVTVRFTPLPTDPYVRDDELVTLTLTPDADGVYRGAYEVRRQADPDDGGHPLPYDHSGRYRIERAFGTLCIEGERVQRMVSEGRFVPDPEALSDEPVTVRVHPPGAPTPIFYESPGAGR